MIYYDPSEDSFKSRLPQEVRRRGRALKDLERVTGADLLLTSSEEQMTLAPLCTVPGRLALRRLTERGLLVQRKSGLDLIQSIPRLDDILARMLEWTEQPWLLVTGQIECSEAGFVVLDGRQTNFSHNALQGALVAWQLRGGYLSVLSQDRLITSWIMLWLDRLEDRRDEKIVSRPVQQLTKSQYPWTQTLATFPGVGPILAEELAQYAGSLKSALFALSSPNFALMPGRPKGFGKKTIDACREWLGLEENEVIVPLKEAD